MGGYQSPSGGGLGGGMGDYFNALGAREGMVSEFDTSLGIRLDYEACLAYLAFPPLGAILLLILERKSDYVRYATGPWFCIGARKRRPASGRLTSTNVRAQVSRMAV
jgi:hypothetical protein